MNPTVLFALICNVFCAFSITALLLKTQTFFSLFCLAFANIIWSVTSTVPIVSGAYMASEIIYQNQKFLSVCSRKMLRCKNKFVCEKVIDYLK